MPDDELSRLRRRLIEVLPSYLGDVPTAPSGEPSASRTMQRDASQPRARQTSPREDPIAYWKPAPSQLATEERARRAMPFYQPKMRDAADVVAAEGTYRAENAEALRQQALQEIAEQRKLDKLKARLEQVKAREKGIPEQAKAELERRRKAGE